MNYSRWKLHNQSQHYQLWQKQIREERYHLKTREKTTHKAKGSESEIWKRSKHSWKKPNGYEMRSRGKMQASTKSPKIFLRTPWKTLAMEYLKQIDQRWIKSDRNNS